MDEARVRFPTGAGLFLLRRLYSGIITDCGSVDPGSIPGLRTVTKDVVAEWLTRLTANQFLSGAQVRVLPTSWLFLGLGRGSSPDQLGKKSWGRGFDPRVGLSTGPTSSVGRAQDSYLLGNLGVAGSTPALGC
jgi:hypothetical protein